MKRDERKIALRCAVYTRVSTDSGLEQDFNSLDNQREASEAYVKSHGLPGLDDGFEPEVWIAVLPTAQSETPVPPKSATRDFGPGGGSAFAIRCLRCRAVPHRPAALEPRSSEGARLVAHLG